MEMNWIVGKLKEGSTWTGIAMLIGSMSFIPHADDVSKTVAIAGTAIAGVLAIWFP
jgi:hypothetical protein